MRTLLERTPFQSQIQHSFELDVGVLGQGAGGRPVQSAVHAAISTHRIPKGWFNQIKNSPAVSLLYMIRQRFGWEFFDVVPHGGVTLGTTQTYPYAGLSLRLGWGLSGFPTLLGRNTSLFGVSRSAWEFGVTGGIEGRYFVRNSFVEGSLFRSAPGIDAVRGVGDYRLGLFLRVVDWRFDYMFVRRSAEVGERGPSERLYDNYGSLQLSYEPGSANDEVSYFFDDLFEKVLEPAFRGFYLEAGIRSELGGGREPGIAKTHGMHVAVGRSGAGSLTSTSASRSWGWAMNSGHPRSPEATTGTGSSSPSCSQSAIDPGEGVSVRWTYTSVRAAAAATTNWRSRPGSPDHAWTRARREPRR